MCVCTSLIPMCAMWECTSLCPCVQCVYAQISAYVCNVCMHKFHAYVCMQRLWADTECMLILNRVSYLNLVNVALVSLAGQLAQGPHLCL